MSTPFPPEEGIGNYVLNLSKGLRAKGHEITIITRGQLKRSELGIADNIRIIKTRFIPFYPFHAHLHELYIMQIIRSLRLEFDLVNIHTPLSPTIKLGIPILSTFHTSLIQDSRCIEVVDPKSFAIKLQTWSFGRLLMSELIRNSALITTVSTGVAYELRRFYKVGNKRIIVIGNGVDDDLFSPARSKNNGNYILYVGRLSYRKGLFDLLECAKMLRSSDIVFILVGKGELEKILREKINAAGLHDKIILAGYLNKEKLIKLYQNAKIFIFPSYYEGLPTVILEAMSCGLPVIATNVGGIRDVITNYYNGILISPRRPSQMAENILMLMENEKLRRRLGENARETIVKNYSWKRIADKVEHLCLGLLNFDLP
jgi:glycosyltransferase involved in cell wall biosynthesis